MWLVSFCVLTLWGVTDDYQHSGRMSLNLEVICSSKTLTTTYKITQHHNTEDHNPQYKMLVGKSQGKTPLWRVRFTWEDIIKQILGTYTFKFWRQRIS
jgi:hypothetical protein